MWVNGIKKKKITVPLNRLELHRQKEKEKLS